MFPQNNDTFRTPKNRYEDATLFEDGNQLDFKPQLSEDIRALEEVREATRIARLASDLAVEAPVSHEIAQPPTLDQVREMSSQLVNFRSLHQDSEWSLEEAA